MNIDQRRKYLHIVRSHYLATSRGRERGQLLDEMESVTGLERKVSIRLMRGPLARKQRMQQRGLSYLAMQAGLEHCLARLPFAGLGITPTMAANSSITTCCAFFVTNWRHAPVTQPPLPQERQSPRRAKEQFPDAGLPRL